MLVNPDQMLKNAAYDQSLPCLHQIHKLMWKIMKNNKTKNSSVEAWVKAAMAKVKVKVKSIPSVLVSINRRISIPHMHIVALMVSE